MPKPSATPLAQALRGPPEPKADTAPVCPTCGRNEWADDVVAAARAYIASVVVKGMERNGQGRLQACNTVLDGDKLASLSDGALEAEVKRRLARRG